MEGPTASPDSSAARGFLRTAKALEAQASSGQETLVTAGTGGRTGESRKDRHAAEHGRLGHQFWGRGAAEAADWEAAPAEQIRRLERLVDGRSAKDAQQRWSGSCFEGVTYHPFAVLLETAAGMAVRAQHQTWLVAS